VDVAVGAADDLVDDTIVLDAELDGRALEAAELDAMLATDELTALELALELAVQIERR
jgi:hypothetical protein